MEANKKIISIENRIPELKKYRQKKLIRHLVILIAFFLLLILITLYFLSPLSKVDKIFVTGNKQLTENKVRKASGIEQGEFVFAINSEKVSKKLTKNPLIKKAKVKKEGLNDYRITITEYNTIGYIEKDGNYYDILENGTMLTQYSHKFPLGNRSIFKNFKNNSDLKDMVKEMNQLPEEVVRAISEVDLAPTKTDPRHISLYMNDGNKVEATISSFEEKMVYYPSIVVQLNKGQKGVIDLEVGSYFQSYYKQNEEKKAASEKAKKKNKDRNN